MAIARIRRDEIEGLGYTVVHRSAGRVRLRLDGPSARRATEIAASLALHPSTNEVRWVRAARSLTIEHDPAVAAELILTRLGQRRPKAILLERVASRPWVGLTALLPAFGLPPIMAELAGSLLAPPPVEVVRRV